MTIKLPYWLLCTLAFPLLAVAAPPTVKPPQGCHLNLAESTPTADFEFLGDGSTVLHKHTRLIWKRCAEGQNFYNNGTPDKYSDDYCDYIPEDASDAADAALKYDEATQFTWAEALQRAADVATETGENWRLPNVKELASIVEERCTSPAQNLAVFIDYNDWNEQETVNQYIFHELWTSSPYRDPDIPPFLAFLDANSWILDTETGRAVTGQRDAVSALVRLVKDAEAD